MSADLEAPDLAAARIAHGFAAPGAPVAAGFHLVRVKQVHGATCLAADEHTASPAGDADAVVTSRPGVAVAIATADCVPLLLAAPEAGVVAAVHAGWRGTVAGIAAVGVHALVERGARTGDVRAALGPAIDGCCYEIERAIAERFACELGDETWRAWRDGERPGKGYLDLRTVNALVLARAGVPQESITRVGPCTFCGGGPFASFRRDAERAARQLSWIALRAA